MAVSGMNAHTEQKMQAWCKCLKVIGPLVVEWTLESTQEQTSNLNPQTPKVFRQPKTPKGVGTTPWIFAFPSKFFGNISHGYFFGVKESNGDNEKFYLYSLLHEL